MRVLTVRSNTIGSRYSAGEAKAVWKFFQEPILKNDNKIEDGRINMITKGTLLVATLPDKAIPAGATPGLQLWELLEPDWVAGMAALGDECVLTASFCFVPRLCVALCVSRVSYTCLCLAPIAPL
jgi:hypothetical protein